MPRDRWLYAWGMGSVAFGAASLLVPLYVVGLGGGAVALGVLAASAAGVGAPGAILAGRLADRAGRQRAIVVGALLAVGAVLLALPFLSSVLAVVAANAVLWLLSASVAPVVTMLVIDGSEESAWNRRIARLNTFQGYGWAGGLVLGTVWTAAAPLLSALAPGWSLVPQRSLFLVCGATAAASGLVAARTLPRESPPGERSRSPTDVRRVARILVRSRRNVKGATFAFNPNRLYWTTAGLRPRQLVERFTPRLVGYFVAAALFFVGFAAFWAPLPLFLTSPAGLSVGPDATFGLYLASSLGSAVAYGAAGNLSSTYDDQFVQVAALAVRAGSFVAVPALPLLAAGTPVLVVAALAVLGVVGLTWAVVAVTGTGIVTRMAPGSVRAEVLGLYTALAALAGGVGGVLGGVLAAVGYPVAFGTAGGLVALGGALVLGLRVVGGRAGERS